MVASPALNVLEMPTRRQGPVHNGHSSTVDVNRLSFPLQVVILIVSVALAAAGSNWLTASGLRSDIRAIQQSQEVQGKALTEIKAQLPNREALELRLTTNEKETQEFKDFNRELFAYVNALRLAMERRGIDTPEPPVLKE
jgi:hypothetical protein